MLRIIHKSSTSRKPLLLLPVLLLTLAGCASTPKIPVNEFDAADTAIKQAEEARVADYASAELRSAREKIASARALSEKAVQDKDKKAMTMARQMAEASRSDAELATAKAQQAQAEKVDTEMQRNNDTLQQELQRNNGVTR